MVRAVPFEKYAHTCTSNNKNVFHYVCVVAEHVPLIVNVEFDI